MLIYNVQCINKKWAGKWHNDTATAINNNNNNKSDIIRDNEKGTCMLIAVAISEDRNLIKKEAEKILKYNDLKI